MQRVLSIFMALCISLTFALDAHAKRFGGGKSFGSAPSHQTRQAPQQTQAAPNQAGRQTPAAASGASRWLGPLAGLAAGGLLASMFMGDGFEGIQFMDILIFGLIAFLLFRFLAARAVAGPELGTASSYERLLRLPAGPAWFRAEAVEPQGPGRAALPVTVSVAGLADLPPLLSRIRRLFDLDADDQKWLQAVPYKGSLPSAVPTDPLIYRWYEMVNVYGTTIKALIHEEFGDGIMSAINCSIDLRRGAHPGGDRVVLTIDGKFLPYDWAASEG